VRFACSVASIARGEPVEATASQVRRWLLVEVTGPWGRDAITQSELGPHAPEVWRRAMKQRGIRIIAIRRDLHHRSDGEGVRLVYVEAPRPGESPATAHRVVVPALHDVVGATASLVGGHRLNDAWRPDSDRYVLVCTNGRHDACCATYGRPLVRDLRDSPWAAQVWECSHIGGDRFAANLVVLPDSLYFGRMEPAEAEVLLDAHAAGQLSLEWFRGRSTLRFAEQAAEHALRTALDVRGIDDVVIPPTHDVDRIRAQVRGIGTIDVVMERTVGIIDEPLTCHGTPSQQVPCYTATELIEVDP
jgi:hypothetical protein